MTDGLDIECDEGCEWPTLVGTADEKAKLHELCMEFNDVFGACPVGGSKLPAMDMTLKKNADGSEMQPRLSLARRTAPWIRQLIRDDAEKRLRKAGTSVAADVLLHLLLPPSSRTRGRMRGAAVLTIGR